MNARSAFLMLRPSALERRFRIGWKGSADEDDNAHPPQPFSRLFGDGTATTGIDSTPSDAEHKANK